MNERQVIIDIEQENHFNNQLQNRNISQRNTFEQRQELHLEFQRERIRNLRIDTFTNISICIGIVGLCGFIGYFVSTGKYLEMM